MRDVDWSYIEELDPNKMWKEIADGIKISMETFIPKTKVNKKKRIQPTWMSKKP